MVQLAIQGHPDCNKEIIELLEMLGGKNKQRVDAIRENYIYFIDKDIINFLKINQVIDGQFNIFTFKEFKEKFPYKIGDKVSIPEYESEVRINDMKWDGFEVQYLVFTNETEWYSAEELNKWNKPYKKEIVKNKSNLLQQLKEYFDNTSRDIIEKEWQEYDKYNDIGPKVNEYLEYVNNIRQPKYPKTYNECCDVLKIPNDERYIDIDAPLDYNKLLSTFTKLLICRDAYWKIAKDWEPDWLNVEQDKYVFFTHNNNICSNRYVLGHNILAFPTGEMRDAFYDNFKDLIEACKELL